MTVKLKFVAIAGLILVLVQALMLAGGCSRSASADNIAKNGQAVIPVRPSGSDGNSDREDTEMQPKTQREIPEQSEPEGSSELQESSGQPSPSQNSAEIPETQKTAEPDASSQILRTFYDSEGNPPQAPGLKMKARHFVSEPSKTVYLTIDDGPYPQTTPRLLEILQDKGVKATFFVLGRQVERYPDLLKAEYEQGHGIGNHSYSHNYATVYQSPESFLQEIKQSEEIIYNTIGVRPRMIRAPGGTQNHFNIAYYNAVDAADYLVYDWNVSTGDASGPLIPASQIMDNVKNQMTGKERAIILMHDVATKKTTVDALPQIIDYLKEQGYSFAVLSPEVTPILFAGGFRS